MHWKDITWTMYVPKISYENDKITINMMTGMAVLQFEEYKLSAQILDKNWSCKI